MAMSRFEEILQAIVNGEECDLTPQSRAEVLLLALLDMIQSGSGGSGGTVNLSNYYKKSQVDALLAAKADSTDLDDYYMKTQTYSQSEVDTKLGVKADSTALDNYYKKTETYSQNEVDTSLSGKVDKVTGKGLSQENYTSEEKIKLAGLNNYDDTALAGRVTVIEGDYANKTYVNEQIANLDNLNKKIVDTLPIDSEADNNTIYMMKTTGSSGDEYEMYTKIDGTLVLIGNTSVDLTGYAKTSDIPTNTSDLTNDSGFLTEHQDISGKVDKVAGKGLSTNDLTDELKTSYDDAVSKTHTHSNKTVLDALTQSVIDNSHTHSNTSVLNKFSEDSEGNPLYNGNGIAGEVDLTDYAKKTDLPVLIDLLDDSASSTETTYSSSKIETELADKSKVVSLTRAEYDALTTKDADTYYIITDEHDVFSMNDYILPTVLYEGSTNHSQGTTLTLLDSIKNYRYIIVYSNVSSEYAGCTTIIPVDSITIHNSTGDEYGFINSVMQSTSVYHTMSYKFISDTKLYVLNSQSSGWYLQGIRKVYGVK